MKRKHIIAIICLFCLSFQYEITAQNKSKVDEIRDELLNPNNNSVLVVAHRGDWRYAPENSLAAIENVIKMGCDVVEIDIQKTKDGHLILMHDNTLDRTTTGHGKISDQTLDDVKKLKLRNGLGIHTRHTVPTLEEALLLAKDKIMINLDKAYPLFDEVYELLKKTGTTKQIIMKGSQPVEQVKKEFGKYLDKVIFMPVINLDKANAQQMIEDYMKKYPPLAFEFSYVSDTNTLPKEMGKRLKGNCLIWYNTLWDTMSGGHDDDMGLRDPDKEYGYLIDTLNARIIQTDVPEFLIKYLKNKNILLVDDEQAILDMVTSILEDDGFHNIYTAKSVGQAILLAEKCCPELAILDVMLPDGSGFDLMEKLKQSSDYPVLFLTARGEDDDKFKGFGLGADDYMVKPFLPKELLFRVMAILRRSYKGENPLVQLRDSQIDFARAEVIKNNEHIPLTAKEHDLLSALYRNAGRIVTIDALCEAAWGDNPFGYENSLMAHIRRIREKIELNPSYPVSLVTVKGLGYKLVVERN